MSGEVKVRKSDWQRTLAAVLLGCLLDGVLMYFFLRRVELTGLARGIVAALGAYVLFRLFYPMLRGLFPGGGERTLLWHVTPDTLVLGREEIPRGAIKAVHCWPNRDALGHAGAGWTVNIETTGKNHLLRSLTEGEGLDQSVRQLRALVVALGYGGQWAGSPDVPS